jgi:hypothetical protein
MRMLNCVVLAPIDASTDCRSVLKVALGPNKSSFPVTNLGVEMAKVVKRREWTKDDVLKTLARQKNTRKR